MHDLSSANVYIALLFVAVAACTLTVTAGALFGWTKRQRRLEEEELPPIQDVQASLARMMEQTEVGSNRSACA